MEPNSVEPFHSSHLSLSCASDAPLCMTGASRGTLDPQSASCEAQSWRTHQSRNVGAHLSKARLGVGKNVLGAQGVSQVHFKSYS